MWIAFRAVNSLGAGNTGPTNLDFNLYAVQGARHWIGSNASMLGNALRLGILVFLAVFGLRVLLRRDWLAVLAASALFTMMEIENKSDDGIILFAVYMGVFSILIFLLLRFGLVASITTVFVVNSFSNITLGASFKTWYTPFGLATFLLVLGIAIYAFWRSLGGRELIGDNPT